MTMGFSILFNYCFSYSLTFMEVFWFSSCLRSILSFFFGISVNRLHQYRQKDFRHFSRYRLFLFVFFLTFYGWIFNFCDSVLKNDDFKLVFSYV